MKQQLITYVGRMAHEAPRAQHPAAAELAGGPIPVKQADEPDQPAFAEAPDDHVSGAYEANGTGEANEVDEADEQDMMGRENNR